MKRLLVVFVFAFIAACGGTTDSSMNVEEPEMIVVENGGLLEVEGDEVLEMNPPSHVGEMEESCEGEFTHRTYRVERHEIKNASTKCVAILCDGCREIQVTIK